MNSFVEYVELNDSCEMKISEFRKPFDENELFPEGLISSLVSFYKKSHNKVSLPLHNAIERDFKFDYNSDTMQISNNIGRIINNIREKNELKHSDRGVEFHNSTTSFECAVFYNMFYSDANIDWRYIKTDDKNFTCAKSLYDANLIPLIVGGEWALYDMETYELICKIDS